MAPTTASAKTPNVTRVINPAKIDEPERRAARPSDVTTMAPIRPAIEVRGMLIEAAFRPQSHRFQSRPPRTEATSSAVDSGTRVSRL